MTIEDIRARYRALTSNNKAFGTGLAFSQEAAATILAAEIIAEAIRELKVNSFVNETFMNEFGPLSTLADR